MKVGGSLLDWPELPERLASWLAAQQAARSVLLGGGGQLTDCIREADRIYRLGQEHSHWLCVEVLGVSARLLAALMGDLLVVSDERELFSLEAPVVVFDPRVFLQTREPRLAGTPLPRSWDATTDSIAARLCQATSACELVLLKSADCPASATLGDLAARRYVDPHFPAAARGLPAMRMVNLRSYGGS